MKKNVGVIGCGQLGRRHIQGLGLSKSDISVHVFDISSSSLEICRSFINGLNLGFSNLDINYYNEISLFARAVENFDLVIVATTANDRPGLIKKLVNNLEVSNWLIEKPLTQSADELDLLLDRLDNKNVWVNHMRRTNPWHIEMKSHYFEDKQIDMIVSGKDIGIGCNISHFVDLVNFWTGELPISVDVSRLAAHWHEAKREGFKEINGKIFIAFSKGSTLVINSENYLGETNFTGKIKSTKTKFSINENKGFITFDDNEPMYGELLFQSQLQEEFLMK